MIVPRFWKDQNEWFVSKKQNDPLKKKHYENDRFCDRFQNINNPTDTLNS